MDKSTFRPIQSHPLTTNQLPIKKRNPIKGNTFSFHFQEALTENTKLTISKHAKERLIERDIQISGNRWEQIEAKVNEARKLGVKESLVLLEDAALIVSAKNNTVITAMDRHEAKTQIFTNINGTIVLE